MICGKCKIRDTTVGHVRECYLKNDPWAPAPMTTEPCLATVADDGIDISGTYCRDGAFYRVVCSDSGHWYAKSWVLEAIFVDNVWIRGNGSWVYDGRAPLHFLRPSQKIGAREAAVFGHDTGTCVFCSRRLTDERSIYAGYGPTCAEREGLPWGSTSDDEQQ